jgi:hypothetical protein
VILVASMLVAQAAGDALHQLPDLAFSEPGQSAPAVWLRDIRVGTYGATIKAWMRIMELRIQNPTDQPWKDFELILKVRTDEDREIPVSIPKQVEAGSTLQVEQHLMRLPEPETIRAVSVALKAGKRGRPIPVRYFEGTLVLARDCIADYNAMGKMSGVALRAALNAFLVTKCGEIVSEQVIQSTAPGASGFVFVTLENGVSGFIPISAIKTGTRWEFQPVRLAETLTNPQGR